MDLGALFLILAVLVLVGMFISRPFFDQQQPGASGLDSQVSQDNERGEHERSALLAEHDRILNSLQELDFDQALGKIPEEDYPAQRGELLQSGIDVLRRLDAVHAVEQVEAGQSAEERLEAAIAARRADASEPALAGERRRLSPVLAAADDPLEALIAARRQTHPEKAAGFCPHCGRPVQKSDHFCPNCGTTLV